MSADEYVPSDEDVYGVWTNYQCFGADDGYGPRGIERAAAEMDRYLARVRRDAWAEGAHTMTTGAENDWIDEQNPYKETPDA